MKICCLVAFSGQGLWAGLTEAIANLADRNGGQF